MNKYGIRIRTHSGLTVENLQVHARDRAEAEEKIGQIYHHCEILGCEVVPHAAGDDASDLESVISLIGGQPPASEAK